MISENQRMEDDDTASSTGEECFSDAELFNRVMEEGSAHSAEEDDLGDELLDAQLAVADRELGEDPFETLPEMDIIEHNIFDL
ncbi:MAG: hypothetical protein ACLPH3_04975 [Terracidiphilus sp.]